MSGELGGGAANTAFVQPRLEVVDGRHGTVREGCTAGPGGDTGGHADLGERGRRVIGMELW